MSIKNLSILIDGISSDIIFDNINKFDTIKRLISNGIGTQYSAYANGGKYRPYTSMTNHGTLFSGISPFEINFEILRNDCIKQKKIFVNEFKKYQPIWKVMNEEGYKTGIIGSSLFEPDSDVNGYFLSEKIDWSVEKETTSIPVDFISYDNITKNYKIDNNIDIKFIYPKSIEMFGYTWEKLLINPELINNIITNDYFDETLKGYDQYLNTYTNLIIKKHKEISVDFLLWIIPYTDYISHIGSYDNNILIEAISIFDKYLKIVLDELSPENTFIFSDHGNWNMGRLVDHPNIDIKKEAFSSSDNSIFLDNGMIVTYARSGRTLFAGHSIDGFLIMSGKKIKKTILNDIRSLDFYPTLLELMDIKIPENREGFVLDIFDKEYINKDRILKENEIIYEKVAVIQNSNYYETDQVISEIYYKYRFIKITVIGEEKYKPIYLNNPRVSEFIAFDENFNIKKFLKDFNKVFTIFYNDKTDKIDYIEII